MHYHISHQKTRVIIFAPTIHFGGQFLFWQCKVLLADPLLRVPLVSTSIHLYPPYIWSRYLISWKWSLVNENEENQHVGVVRPNKWCLPGCPPTILQEPPKHTLAAPRKRAILLAGRCPPLRSLIWPKPNCTFQSLSQSLCKFVSRMFFGLKFQCDQVCRNRLLNCPTRCFLYCHLDFCIIQPKSQRNIVQ